MPWPISVPESSWMKWMPGTGHPGPDQAEVTVPGIQFVQDDSGPEFGQAIAAWLRQLAR